MVNLPMEQAALLPAEYLNAVIDDDDVYRIIVVFVVPITALKP